MRCTRLATITTLAFLVALPAVGAPEDEPMTTAWFEGRLIDLAEDWEEAQACLVSDVSESAECFRTEEELDSRMATVEIAWSSSIGGPVPFGTCSSSLKLYDGTNYATPLVAFTTTGIWINLSSYSFDNKTSSFKVGACSSVFTDSALGGGDEYPTSKTTAGKQSSSMGAGWNNRVSSVRIG